MKTNYKVYLLTALATIFLINCSKEDGGRMPLSSNSEKAVEYFEQGLEFAQNLRQQEAVYYYLKAIGEDPEFAMAYVQLALVQTTPKLVFKYLNKAKSLISNVSRGEELSILAIEAGLNNELQKENDYFLQALELYPKDDLLNSIYASFLYQISNYEDAIKYYNRTLELNPDNTQAYNMLGYSYRQIGDYEQAEKYLKKYLEFINDNPNPYDSYAELLLKKGEFSKSIEFYRKALEIQPTFFASKIGIATNLTLMGQHDAACEELESIKKATSDPGILKQMNMAKAVVNVDRQNFEQAAMFIKENISISKEIEDDISLANDLNNLATIKLMEGELKEALRYYEKSIDFYERADISQDLKYFLRRQLFINTSWIAYFNNDVEKIKTNKTEYISSAPQDLNLIEVRNVHLLSGHINLLEQNYENAIYEYNQANLENPRVLYLIGTAYENLSDYKTAFDYYSTVANFNALNSLNYAYIRKIALDKLKEF